MVKGMVMEHITFQMAEDMKEDGLIMKRTVIGQNTIPMEIYMLEIT